MSTKLKALSKLLTGTGCRDRVYGMGPTEKIFKKEYAKELFKIAQNDWVSGEALAKVPSVRRETVLFHIEQSVEKALKAVLCYQQKPVPFTHDIYAIVQRFDPNNMPPGGYALHDLTPFASIRRYEEGNYIVTEEDVAQAMTVAQQVLMWAEGLLKK